MTNEQNLKSMATEELAAYLADHPVVSEFDPNNRNHMEWFYWLKRETDVPPTC